MGEGIINLININKILMETSKKMYDAAISDDWDLIKTLTEEQNENIKISENIMKNMSRTHLINKILK